MPQFILDTAGEVAAPPSVEGTWPWSILGRSPDPLKWKDLDAFTQGYIEALFFTDQEQLGEQSQDCQPEEIGFSYLAPETLLAILEDCRDFQAGAAWKDALHALRDDGAAYDQGEAQGGHDFWLTRNGHGAGFWDGDWVEPHGTALTTWADTFGGRDSYLGDDGLVYLS